MLTCERSDCGSGITECASKYVAFGKLYATKAGPVKGSKSTVTAGVEGSYGLFQAFYKCAFYNQQVSSGLVGVVEKQVDLVRKAFCLSYSDQSDSKEPNRIDIQIFLQFLFYLNAAVAGINRACPISNPIVLKFYQEYGSHFISSVTRGKNGYFESSLAFTGSQGCGSSNFAGGTSFGGSFGLLRGSADCGRTGSAFDKMHGYEARI